MELIPNEIKLLELFQMERYHSLHLSLLLSVSILFLLHQSILFRPHQRYTVRHRFTQCEQLYTSLFCLTLFIIGGLLHLTTSVSMVEAPGTAPGSSVPILLDVINISILFIQHLYLNVNLFLLQILVYLISFKTSIKIICIE